MTDLQFFSYLILWAIGSLWVKWLYKKTQPLEKNDFTPGKMHIVCSGCLPFIVLPACLFFTIMFYINLKKNKYNKYLIK